ncbi:MAG TPA: glycosyltransferase family 39 protein, partial [Pedococcus sp.]
MTLLDHETAQAPHPSGGPAPARPVSRLRARWAARPAPDGVEAALLVLALTVGGALRFIGLGAVGLNSDEAVYAAQAASLAGNHHFTALFPVVRAHPLLLQTLISPFYATGMPDTAGRYATAGFGVGTIILTYVLGRVLYHRRVGALGALLLAVMPYHVIISRQIILDGPMAFFLTGALLCLAVAARRRDGRWLVATGAALGLAVLSKEPAVIMLGSCFAFLALTTRVTRPLRHPLVGAGVALGLTASYPVLTAIAGGGHGGASYLIWQLSREPNHTFTFYLTTVGVAMGVGTLLLATGGLVAFHRTLGWRETLLLSWLAVPLAYFEIWPTKGFTYLTALAPVVALLAAAAVFRLGWWGGRRRLAAIVLAAGCVVSLVVPSVLGIARPTTSGLAGAGGLPGGREAGRWIATHSPERSQFITIGPSMANIVQFYGGRRADGLSVSPNPLHRNPSYSPIRNADLALRDGTYQYIVWDTYSAHRS